MWHREGLKITHHASLDVVLGVCHHSGPPEGRLEKGEVHGSAQLAGESRLVGQMEGVRA